ncbi:TlpA family protein disulfide reductase [Mucilaginibacter auburnensis]|nr:TlpA disulfide reductase family protein [Mucilaginibacter auburnensis]
MEKLKALLTRKNIINVVFILLMLVLIINPAAKALLIRGFIAVGIMRPPTQSEKVATSTPSVNITLRQPNGEVLQSEKLKGKVLIMNFWATWCPPCIAEMPSINKMYLQYKNNSNLVVIPIDADNDVSKSTAFMQNKGYSLPVYTLAGPLPTGLVSNAIPTTIIIDKKGRVVARHEGAADYSSEAFYEYLDGLLKE